MTPQNDFRTVRNYLPLEIKAKMMTNRQRKHTKPEVLMDVFGNTLQAQSLDRPQCSEVIMTFSRYV